MRTMKQIREENKIFLLLFLKEKHLCSRSLIERMAILFQWKVLLLFLLFVSIFVFCFSVDKGRAAALGLSPVRLGCSLTFWPGAPWHGLSARRKSRKHTQVH